MLLLSQHYTRLQALPSFAVGNTELQTYTSSLYQGPKRVHVSLP